MQKQAVGQIVSSEERKEEEKDKKTTDKDKKANNAGPNKSIQNQVKK